MGKLFKKIIVLFFLMIFSSGCSRMNKYDKIEINISAAASLKESMIEIKDKYENINKNVELVINYGSSGSLKQQIEQGAPCDLFISAGQKQIDELKSKDLLIKESIKELVQNELVLITPKNSNITNINELKGSNIKHIGIGEPSSVPAGLYADQALNSLSLNAVLKHKLILGKDVKEVLAWVTSGNADAGFVYYSDAINNKNVNIVEIIDKNAHEKVVYPMAIIDNSKNIDEAKNIQDFLLKKEGQDIFKKYGYK